ncbi:MAG TPA: globin [Phycisphaerales bacterium]|jgi:hemoglobin|nr:globin [Phycisphaerales bacterium]
MLSDADIYARLGEEGFTRLIRAFYARIPSDPILGPKYERSLAARGDTMADAELRLRDFLIGRFGGPQRYIQQHGHPRLRQRHARFVIDDTAARHWITIMQQAMADANIEPEVAAVLGPYFHETALFMINH